MPCSRPEQDTRRLCVTRERWPIAGGFVISRGAKRCAEVVVVELRQGAAVGRGECVPYAHYGETVESVCEAIESARGEIEAGAGRARLQCLLPAGAARNALDCALWDLEAKCSGEPVWKRAELAEPAPVVTAYTLSLGTPRAMARRARAERARPLLKLKLGAPGDADRVRAVRDAAPQARLIADVNEGWTPAALEQLAPELAACGVALIEQPLPARDDAWLASYTSPIPLCADESARDRAALPRLRGLYAAVNVKLDKTGGLTEALAFVRDARALGFEIFVGCMVGTSLAMAPALLLAGLADYVDLDGPLLLARDREPGLRIAGSRIEPAPAALWG